jgi:YD repeat-containing protein
MITISVLVLSLVPSSFAAQGASSQAGRAAATPQVRAVETVYAYDAAGRLVETVHDGEMRRQFAFDPAGNLLSVVTSAVAPAPAASSAPGPHPPRSAVAAGPARLARLGLTTQAARAHGLRPRLAPFLDVVQPLPRDCASHGDGGDFKAGS